MRIVGITGGIAAGKSTVLHMFAELGASTLSADEIARKLLTPGSALTESVLDVFPWAAVPNETVPTIDRAVLRRAAFQDPLARQRLEELTHPPIIAEIEGAIEHWRAQWTALACAEIPLLFEADLQRLVDYTVVVACSEEEQLSRISGRLGISEDEAREMTTAQWPLSRKIALADHVINTDGSLEETRRDVVALWDEWRS